MPTNPTLSMQKRFAAAQSLLAAVQADSTIAARLRRVGFGEDRIEEGIAILAGVEQAMSEAEAAIAAQQAATVSLLRARRQLENNLRDVTQLAKVQLGDGHPWLALAGVPPRQPRGGGGRKVTQSLEAVLERSRTFFSAVQSADTATQPILQKMGLGTVAIKMAEGFITSVERAAAAQQAQMARAEQRIAVRAAAFETLDDWMRECVAVARVALRDKPDLLASLGVTQRGRPRKVISE